MKIYVPSAVTGSDCRFFTEIFSVIPFLNTPEAFKAIQDHCGYWNDGLYSKLFLAPTRIERVHLIKDADYIVLPFKYAPDDLRVEEFCKTGLELGKKVISFYNDDNATPWELPSNLILFRTSANKSQMRLNERILPVIVPDHKPAWFQLEEDVENYQIGFMGQHEGIRGPIIDKMQQIWPEFDLVRRAGFWAPEMTKLEARRDFYKHMMASDFTLCMRGGGNFSYRFYEALSFGRIPVLIDTDMELPFEAPGLFQINWDNHIVRIRYDDFIMMDRHDLHKAMTARNFSPRLNRKLWEQYFAPESFFEMFQHDL